MIYQFKEDVLVCSIYDTGIVLESVPVKKHTPVIFYWYKISLAQVSSDTTTAARKNLGLFTSYCKLFKKSPRRICGWQPLKMIWSAQAISITIYHCVSINFFKGCPSQIFLFPFLNTLTHLKNNVLPQVFSIEYSHVKCVF